MYNKRFFWSTLEVIDIDVTTKRRSCQNLKCSFHRPWLQICSTLNIRKIRWETTKTNRLTSDKIRESTVPIGRPEFPDPLNSHQDWQEGCYIKSKPQTQLTFEFPQIYRPFKALCSLPLHFLPKPLTSPRETEAPTARDARNGQAVRSLPRGSTAWPVRIFANGRWLIA